MSRVAKAPINVPSVNRTQSGQAVSVKGSGRAVYAGE